MNDALEAPVSQAIVALTTAARATWTMDDRTERYDFGEIACRVLAAVAANLGGIDALLAGRPGSWEADHVRQMLYSTVGYDEEYLMEHRTEPVRLVLDPEDVFYDFGLYVMHDDEANTAAEETFDETKTEAELNRAEAVSDAIEQLYQDDLTAYVAAYTDTVKQAAVELGITVPVELDRVEFGHRGEPEWDTLAVQLHDAARERTPAPATGQAPRDHKGLPADVARTAGRTYRARAEETLTREQG